ncbi:uncharacterized protein EI90DRAFT_2943755 [Cantharellus anzutake]|uniref:uncharacterized protein n=1 Tax=Cantharellus anzutake TaxID=1750568 RepID=UPI0019060DD6|nr:uncharacterized protein EI90DRAFT_2943755 [Cantharellus anzutake]KAF8317035.1 hypothetical protein EI90DRAFT_2943755 [Cantharellus anzutake]
MIEEAPPPPYPTSLPDKFPIGKQYTSPLVNVADLQDHLRLLGAFDLLQNLVRSANPSDSDDAWIVYLARAVYRFEKWILANPSDRSGPETLPPLDVLMVWHSYCLNPRNYYEDGVRSIPAIRHTPKFPLAQAANAIDAETLLPLPVLPSSARSESWTQLTNMPFDLVHTTGIDEVVAIPCPACPTANLMSVPWVTKDKSGYAQADFRTLCPHCRIAFNRESMCVRKFCNDVVKVRDDPDHQFLAYTILFVCPSTRLNDVLFFRGTLLSPITGAISAADSKRVVPRQIGSKVIWLTGSTSECTLRHVGSPCRMMRVLSCYENPTPFSIELSGAVIRQGAFVKKMVGLEWTRPGHFDVGHQHRAVHVLVRSIARYHAFVDLLSSALMFFVPTIDIDLTWHTHQLDCRKYRSDTLALLGRTPDHDDKVEEGALSSAYDITARAWGARFGVPYSVCGCTPLTSTNRLMNKVSRILGGKKSQDKPIQNTRPDLVSTLDDDADATHPSEHNSVVIPNHDAHRAERARKLGKRIKELEKDKEKGRLTDWEKLRLERMQREGHDRAFIYGAVPYWGL